MPGILDVGPLSEEVKVGRGTVTVEGLTIDDIFHLVANFAEIRAILEKKISQVTPAALMKAAPRVLGTVITYGTGERGDDKAVKAAMKLPAAVQLRLITTIFDLTFPDGVGPFVRELSAIQRVFLAPPAPPKEQSETTKDSDTESSERVSAALQADMDALKHYAPRPDKLRRGPTVSSAMN